jgi:hypothetical protein
VWVALITVGGGILLDQLRRHQDRRDKKPIVTTPAPAQGQDTPPAATSDDARVLDLKDRIAELEREVDELRPDAYRWRLHQEGRRATPDVIPDPPHHDTTP